ncbi:hypothetical protein EV663_11421 [Rhodovulum bhavnagarense]|uniref:AbrB family transcriptional regulator n=2 Tax=Rhodovulum bhavnagarense TaxID=992286 RepID=A0A4R2RL33_9RHOB|nr:hypothetical protein EV663_11421 [Rhodovulum bhavnagarense]
MHPALGRPAHAVLIYGGALISGLAASRIGFPLPWMLGAMLFAAGVRLADRPVAIPVQTRQAGQVLVACSVGLSFTPEAVATMGALLWAMLAAAILTVAIGFVVAAALMRLARVDVITAVLSSVPMGPVESAVLAQAHGVAPGPVVFAQTLRITALVIVIPPSIVALDGTVRDPVAMLARTDWSLAGAAFLVLAGMGGALVAHRLRLANPFFVGALAGAALAAAFSLPITAFPYPVLVVAQMFLGVWLGAVFDRDLLRRARGFIPAALVSSLLLTILCAGMGLGLAWLTGQPGTVMILATAPGSVTEMALTAKILQEGLALVTAFHLVRIFVIIPNAGRIIGLTARLAGWISDRRRG